MVSWPVDQISNTSFKVLTSWNDTTVIVIQYSELDMQCLNEWTMNIIPSIWLVDHPVSISRVLCMTIFMNSLNKPNRQLVIVHESEHWSFLQVEPGVMLYPASFALPTAVNLFQYEITRSKVTRPKDYNIASLNVIMKYLWRVKYALQNCMPVSTAMFASERKNVMPLCPPRLQVYILLCLLYIT